MLYKQPKGVVIFNRALGDNNDRFLMFWCVHMNQGLVVFKCPQKWCKYGFTVCDIKDYVCVFMMLQEQDHSQMENENESQLIKQHHSVKLSASPKPLFDLKGKIKLQLHTFLPMMSWKCMLTAWSTDCSASKVINPKPSQRPRVNQGSRGVVTTQDEEQYWLQQSEDPSRLSKRLLGFGWCRRLVEQHKSKTKSWVIEGNFSLQWNKKNCK